MRHFAVTLMFLDKAPYVEMVEATSPAQCLRYIADVILAAITEPVVEVAIVEVP
jgi:hypothetical protein